MSGDQSIHPSPIAIEWESVEFGRRYAFSRFLAIPDMFICAQLQTNQNQLQRDRKLPPQVPLMYQHQLQMPADFDSCVKRHIILKPVCLCHSWLFYTLKLIRLLGPFFTHHKTFQFDGESDDEDDDSGTSSQNDDDLPDDRIREVGAGSLRKRVFFIF
jgi:hypothetical protein